MLAYCENCGSKLTSLFCESCGTLSSNIPNSYSTDDSLAGLLANVIKQGKPLLFSQVLSLTKSIDRTFRIFSQLERTTNYSIVKQNKDYLIKSIRSTKDQNQSIDIIKTENKMVLIKSLLELFPISKSDLEELFPLQIPMQDFVKYLGSNYELKNIYGQKALIKKRN